MSLINNTEDNLQENSDVKYTLQRILLYVVLSIGAIVTLFPFFYMLVIATRTRADIFAFPPPLWFGDSFMDNLNILLDKMPFFRNIFNSVLVAVSTTIMTMFFCALGGYGFAKYDFKWKSKLFFLMLGTMMIPALLRVIPWFIMMRKFGWINTFWPLIIPGIANPFGIFLMKQFMDDIPDSIIDAARIDGCSEFEIFYKIALPLSLPGLGTLGILTFLASWNKYMQPLLILQEKSMYTIPVALSKLQGKIDQNWGAQMVGTTLAIAPIVIVFVLASKQFISGITEGATKG